MILSIIVPVRKDCPWISYLLESIRNNTDNTENVEVLLGIAHDDTTTEAKVTDDNVQVFRLDQRKRKLGVGDYTNYLALKAEGDLIWWLSDEVVIKTKGFDSFLRLNASQCAGKIYKLAASSADGGGWAYPMITKRWIEATGRWCNHVSIDSWVNHIGGFLPEERSIYLQDLFIEDRCLTGKIPRSDYARLTPEVGHNERDWVSKEVRDDCMEDVNKLLVVIGLGY